MNLKLEEGIDFTYDEAGNMVFTREYLLKRSYCCESGCRNCPYDYHSKVDPEVPSEIQKKNQSDELEVYEGEIPDEFLPKNDKD